MQPHIHAHACREVPNKQQSPHLAPLPADLVLVALQAHVGVHTLAADQLVVGKAPVSLLDLGGLPGGKVLAGIAVVRGVGLALLVPTLLEAGLSEEHDAALFDLQCRINV